MRCQFIFSRVSPVILKQNTADEIRISDWSSDVCSSDLWWAHSTEGARALSLREKLKALEELQQIDLEANEVSGALGAIPAKRTAVEAAIVEARQAYDDEKQRLDANERERRQ